MQCNVKRAGKSYQRIKASQSYSGRKESAIGATSDLQGRVLKSTFSFMGPVGYYMQPESKMLTIFRSERPVSLPTVYYANRSYDPLTPL